MDFDSLITETLERVAPDVQAGALVKEDVEALWYVEFEDGVVVSIRCLKDQRKVVCYSSVAAAEAVQDSNWQTHEWLLSEAHDAVEADGPTIATDDERLVIIYEIPLATVAPESLTQGLDIVHSAAVRWKETFDEADEVPPADTDEDVSGAIRV